MRGVVVGILLLSALFATTDARAQQGPTTVRHIYISAVEFKGSTTTDKVPAPRENPGQHLRGYTYKGPGDADPAIPQKWEVASYHFSPAFVAVQQGDTIVLSVFVVNGDHHQVQLTGPDGKVLIDKVTWDRGREYSAFFLADKVGVYHLSCGTHAPSMTATIMVLAR
jgi:plastocyanin